MTKRKKLLLFSVVLTAITLLGFFALRLTHASVADMQMKMEIIGDLDVRQYNGALNAKDYGSAVSINASVATNITSVYDSTTLYLRVQNVGSNDEFIGLQTNLDPEYFSVDAIWFMSNEWLLHRYGNIWRSYNGGYFNDGGSVWFADLPTASWRLYNNEEGVWLEPGCYVPLHVTITVIQPPPTMPSNFVLTVHTCGGMLRLYETP